MNYRTFETGIPCGGRPPTHLPEHVGTNQEPWYSRSSIEFLADNLDDSMEVLEYGCGSSTLWFAQRVKSVIAIEHVKTWADEVTQLVPKSLESKVDVVHIPNQEQGQYAGHGGRFYDNYLDKTFDMICVDGRCRAQSIINSMGSLKNNGLLLIDNAERGQYHAAISQLPREWVRLDFPSPITLTSIFKVSE